MRARRTHPGVAAIWIATGRRVLDSHGPVCREIARQRLDMLDRRIHPRLHSGVRRHCFDFSNMVRPDDDSADLRAFRSMAQRPIFVPPKAIDPRCRDTQRGNSRTTHGLKGRVAGRKFYVDGFGNFHLSNGILSSDPYPYF
jgi:hypothetical protein